MVGKITITSVNVCCHRLNTIVNPSNNTTRWKQIKLIIRNNPTYALYTGLLICMFFVLFITNQKPAYKHTISSYENKNIHDEQTSKFNYGVVIDCGSSGSRVFIYYWPPHTGKKNELLKIKQMIDLDGNPVRLKIKPGISSFGDKPQNASNYLLPLLRFAAHHIPRNKHRETPLYILATAGMRLLPKHKQFAIMENVRKQIPTLCDFFFTNSQAEVISGKQEGIYLWIATNYILNRFDHKHIGEEHNRQNTVGTIEIGGASFQIAYEIPSNVSIPHDLGATINLGCDVHAGDHEYKIYVTTFLGYGADVARKNYIKYTYNNNRDKVIRHETILDPCLPMDLVDEHTVEGVKFKVTGTGEYERCEYLMKSFVNNQTVKCVDPPCSFNGVHQSPINYKEAEFYGFAEFWYSTNDVLRIGGDYLYSKIQNSAKEHCKTRWAIHKRHYAMGLYPKADDYRFKYQCFKSAWVTTVFHEGLKFPMDYKGLKTVQMIDGKEVQWTLGALLYRTRFLPLKDIKSHNGRSVAKAYQGETWFILHQGFYPILLFCVLATVAAVLYYFHRLKKYSRVSTYHDHQDQELQGLVMNHSASKQHQYPYDVRIEM
ncbi:ectonucleoside triphosphate diphosphohydrolase 4-like [Clytia hemisphaerica]|uniref:Ectonucleoside triphosphate diphosphohydrolase n=1 Tax=Clytia hemisphaerica TaxID=252671 RepID=A0A7M5WZU4_9CNID